MCVAGMGRVVARVRTALLPYAGARRAKLVGYITRQCTDCPNEFECEAVRARRPKKCPDCRNLAQRARSRRHYRNKVQA